MTIVIKLTFQRESSLGGGAVPSSLISKGTICFFFTNILLISNERCSISQIFIICQLFFITCKAYIDLILVLLYRCDTHKYGSKKKEKFCYCTQDLCNGAHSNSLGSTWLQFGVNFGSIWSLDLTLCTSLGSFDLMILLVLLLLRTLWSEEKKVILCTTRVQKRISANTFLFTVALDLCIKLDLHF